MTDSALVRKLGLRPGPTSKELTMLTTNIRGAPVTTINGAQAMKQATMRTANENSR